MWIAAFVPAIGEPVSVVEAGMQRVEQGVGLVDEAGSTMAEVVKVFSVFRLEAAPASDAAADQARLHGQAMMAIGSA